MYSWDENFTRMYARKLFDSWLVATNYNKYSSTERDANGSYFTLYGVGIRGGGGGGGGAFDSGATQIDTCSIHKDWKQGGFQCYTTPAGGNDSMVVDGNYNCTCLKHFSIENVLICLPATMDHHHS